MEARDNKKNIYKGPVSIFDAIRLWRTEKEKQPREENKTLHGSEQQEEKPKKEYSFPFEIF